MFRDGVLRMRRSLDAPVAAASGLTGRAADDP
jgi:hypothetical protein